MMSLSPAARHAVDTIANRHGFSGDAGIRMFEALRAGSGAMAQFNHPEFAGAGQWMRGGMTMVADMFNLGLKHRVDALCSELAALIAENRPELFAETQSGATNDPDWPDGLQRPALTGAQNGSRYAWFPEQRRLAIERAGAFTVYDTLDHRIGGVSQQQSGSASLEFTSQHGRVDISRLPQVAASARRSDTAPPDSAGFSPGPRAADSDQVLELIDRLAELHARGVLDDEEFSRKKAELLARL